MNSKNTILYYIKGIVTKPKSVIKFGRFLVQNTYLFILLKIKNRNEKYVSGKVTIITPTYKRLRTLCEAVESVQKQTYSNFEHIIISDGYDHDVKIFVDKIGDSRFIYKNTFPLHTMGNYQRNYALKFATGEFVIYLDDDNVIYPNCLECMVRGFSLPEIGYVIAPIDYGDRQMHPKHPFQFGKIDLLNYMIKRKLIDKVWGQSMHYCADLYLIQEVSAISKGNRIDDLIGHHR